MLAQDENEELEVCWQARNAEMPTAVRIKARSQAKLNLNALVTFMMIMCKAPIYIDIEIISSEQTVNLIIVILELLLDNFQVRLK